MNPGVCRSAVRSSSRLPSGSAALAPPLPLRVEALAILPMPIARTASREFKILKMLIIYKQFQRGRKGRLFQNRRECMRQLFRTTMLVAALGGIFIGATNAQDRVRIGVLNDPSGVFSTYQGIGSGVSTQKTGGGYVGQG